MNAIQAEPWVQFESYRRSPGKDEPPLPDRFIRLAVPIKDTEEQKRAWHEYNVAVEERTAHRNGLAGYGRTGYIVPINTVRLESIRHFCTGLIESMQSTNPELISEPLQSASIASANARATQLTEELIAQHGDVIVCGTEEHAAVVNECARSLGAPYFKFRVVFLEGVMDWHGESFERKPDSIPLTAVWCSLGDYDNILAYRRIDQNTKAKRPAIFPWVLKL